MKKNSTSKKPRFLREDQIPDMNNKDYNDPFFYLGTDNNIRYYEKGFDEMIIQNLYAIKYLMAGPIAKLMIKVDEAMKDPVSYRVIQKHNDLYTYEEAMNIIVSWFLERASSIESMKEDKYIGGIATEELFRQYLNEQAKKTGKEE